MTERERPTILVTGFGRFPGARDNPSASLARALARCRIGIGADCDIRAHVFDVIYDSVDRELPRLIENIRPDVLVMFGVASLAKTIRIEAVARNRLRVGLPDAARKRPSGRLATPQGPAMRAPRVAARAVARAAQGAGYPARVSFDAGGYLCNYLYWRALEHERTRRGAMLALFVHVPPTARMTPAGRARLVAAGRAVLRRTLIARRR